MRYQIPVQLADRSYTAHVGSGILSTIGPLVASSLLRQAHRAFIVADSRLPSGHILAAAESLKSVGLPSRVLAFKPSEQDKSLASLERILVDMAKAKLERDDPVIAMGGGIVGDLAGFAAAIYRRGVPVIQCPTTLLSMVDASVGGKTGVNLDMGEGPLADLKKNLIGSFHQPRLVVADIDTLHSLPPRILRSGLAECIKHGVLGADTGDPNLLDWTQANLPAMLRGDHGTLGELVARNISLKARVVASDEREEASDEKGGRALLNLGHTFGHAFETLPGLMGQPGSLPGGLQHGEAVGLGMIAAAHAAAFLQLCPPAFATRLTSLIALAQLPTTVSNLPSNEKIVERMLHDKKVVGSVLRLVLPKGAGGASIVRNPPMQAVEAGLNSIRFSDQTP
jgi:3-dehydroquinate synthase